MKRYFVIFATLFFSLGLVLETSAQAQGQNPPAQSQNQREHPPRIGDINYVEGQATLDGQPIGANSVGTAVLGQGQMLNTQAGKVEVLLTPGVFLRVDNNSVVKMVSPDLARTEIEVDKGRAMVEVLDINKNNDIRVDENGVSTKLEKKGLYDFDADHQEIRVFKGEAQTLDRGQTIKISGEHELALDTGGKPKPHNFDTRRDEDDFFRWNALRSGYLAEATADQAGEYIGNGPGWYGPDWYGAGWYWDPWFDGWTFIPGDGIFYSPFGWGFYSPIFIYNSPYYFYGGGRFGHVPHHFGDFHGPYGHGFEPRGGFHGGGFHGGGGGFHGGGGSHGGGGGHR